MAAAAALALALSLVLPWYQKSYFQGGKVVQANVSALGVFTFVEAAVLLVAGRRAVPRLGALAAAAASICPVAMAWRSRSPGAGPCSCLSGGCSPSRASRARGDDGIQWGIFGALVAAGALIVAGARVRAARRRSRRNPAAEDVDWAPRQRERESVPTPAA